MKPATAEREAPNAAGAEPPAGRRPRARQHSKILDATVEVLLASGFAGLTIEGVAERTGVAKTTIYRWWPSKEALAADAIVEIGERAVPIPDTGRLQSDLVALLAEIVASMQDPRSGALLREVVAESIQAPEIQKVLAVFWQARRAASIPVLERAVARGELEAATDFDLLLDALVGPAYFRFLLTGAPLSHAFTTSVAEKVVAAFATPR